MRPPHHFLRLLHTPTATAYWLPTVALLSLSRRSIKVATTPPCPAAVPTDSFSLRRLRSLVLMATQQTRTTASTAPSWFGVAHFPHTSVAVHMSVATRMHNAHARDGARYSLYCTLMSVGRREQELRLYLAWPPCLLCALRPALSSLLSTLRGSTVTDDAVPPFMSLEDSMRMRTQDSLQGHLSSSTHTISSEYPDRPDRTWMQRFRSLWSCWSRTPIEPATTHPPAFGRNRCPNRMHATWCR